MKILILSTATSYTLSGQSLNLRVSFSWFTKPAEKSLLGKAARLNSSTTQRSSPGSPSKRHHSLTCQPDWLPDSNFTPFIWQLRRQLPESSNIYLN